ncbi:hypothetical protein EOPP23_14480 [Endozoicomonas sp. OPT23]|uniref:DUF6586 family protein n=1 Tax=Endozoicomonas sp. OPT23 TaxID=2072845 RepID=UPI00129AE3BA|nr:DUF6586 family protein [Endozoicomonas sp. OPT23]MRI34197.1 hypothetical protein [Endozoicomonas sp. OPT23]
MSSSWQSITNKKLHNARLQLDAWESAESMAYQGFREGFLFQCKLAYQSLLSEIVNSYGISDTAVRNLHEAGELIKSKDTVSSELEQLQQLENTDSWLSTLLSEIGKLEALSLSEFQPIQYQASLLASDAVTSDDIKSIEQAQHSLKAMKELVTHFRNFNLEW